MGCLIKRKTQIIFMSASSVDENGTKRKVVIESRPQFAIVKLHGSRKRFPIAWELIYEMAERHHSENLRLEARAKQQLNRSKKRSANH
jgi:hypothetical protein